jgi:hypothetical protein
LAEVEHGALLVLVNQSFVRRYYVNGDILGHSLKFSKLFNDPPRSFTAPGADGWLQVIGVVGDALNNGIEKPAEPAIFAPYSLQLWMGTSFLVRSHVAPETLERSIRKQLAGVNPDQQTDSKIEDLETWIRHEPVWARGRLISALFAGFSILALVLSAVGLYSVSSYSVVQRTNEFGIRMALGAGRAHVFRIVMTSAGTSVSIGIAAGLALSFGLNRLISSWVGTTTNHPLLVISVSFLLLVVAAMACIAPARRALSVDPMTALRRE